MRSRPAPATVVLEVGPGMGGLTAPLLERAGRVIAIEKDRDLIPVLKSRFPSLDLVEADALDLDWHTLAQPGEALLVTGNIPYNITSPLLDKALLPPRPGRIVFLVQKEVADRVTAAPGTPEYGALSIGVQVVARAERLFTVPAGAFHPRPKVDSAVLRLTPLADPSSWRSEREKLPCPGGRPVWFPAEADASGSANSPGGTLSEPAPCWPPPALQRRCGPRC